MAVPDWLPDWRDESQYPSKDSKATDFIWEFLRRNASFQEDFANCPGKPFSGGKESRDLANKYGLNIPYVPHPSTPAKHALAVLDTHNSPRILGYELAYRDPEETDAVVTCLLSSDHSIIERWLRIERQCRMLFQTPVASVCPNSNVA